MKYFVHSNANTKRSIMEFNWSVIIPVAVLVIILIIFVIRRNQKDQKEVEQELKSIRKKDEPELNDGDDML